VCVCVALQRPGAASAHAGAAHCFRPPACSRACAPALQPDTLQRTLRLLALSHRPDAIMGAGPSRLPPDLATNKVCSSLPMLSCMALLLCYRCTDQHAMLQVAFKLFGCIPGHVGLRGRVEAVGDGRDTVKVRRAPGAAARRAGRHALAAFQCLGSGVSGSRPVLAVWHLSALPWRFRARHRVSVRPAPASRHPRLG